RARQLVEGLTPERRHELAETLGLPEATLAMLPFLGFDPEDRWGPCWTFPEVDGAGRVVGIRRRYQNGDKKLMQHASPGLTLPHGWQERGGPVLGLEGAGDTLAATAVGLAAVGRPNDTGGVEALAELFRAVPPEREIIIIGHFDPKRDGRWPGRDGAAGVAARLQGILGRPVYWALPPGEKDVRDWVRAHNLDPTCADEWQEMGQQLLAEVQRLRQPAGEGAGPRPPDPQALASEKNPAHLTDWGNAIRLVRRHGHDLRYCHPW